jgi:hypothetical protein
MCPPVKEIANGPGKATLAPVSQVGLFGVTACRLSMAVCDLSNWGAASRRGHPDAAELERTHV